MADVKPFSGLRFTKKAGSPESCCCPPYDIISQDEKEALLSKNPHNAIRLELPGERDEDYSAAAALLEGWRQEGVLARDKEPSYYLYELDFSVDKGCRRLYGICASVGLCEFSEGVVLPHERTLSRAKEDRFRLLSATRCNISPVYSLYNDKDGVTSEIFRAAEKIEPFAEFCEDGVTHRMRRIIDKSQINALTDFFKDKKLYIADGHHRYETALRYRASRGGAGGSGRVMMFLAPAEQEGLVVFPTHRIIHSLPDFSPEKFLSAAKKHFFIEKTPREEIAERLDEAYNKNKRAFGYYDGAQSLILTLSDISAADKASGSPCEKLARLDVSVLHNLLLEKLLGIDAENQAKQINLTYTRNSCEAFAAVDSGADLCFILNPTRVEEITAVANAGEKMPQKSTYFYPKLITGLVMNPLD